MIQTTERKSDKLEKGERGGSHVRAADYRLKTKPA